MKRFFMGFLAIFLLAFPLSACGGRTDELSKQPAPDKNGIEQTTPENTDNNNEKDEQTSENPNETENEEEQFMDTIYLTIGTHKIPVKLEENAATKALVELLKEGDITYTAHDYGDFEKVGDLGHTLPHSDKQMTTETGDVILYLGNQIVLFYGSNSWSYTKLGKMQGFSAAELYAILTESNPISVKISLQ